jgi:NitT/TauT family transport system substrate-binding protein
MSAGVALAGCSSSDTADAAVSPPSAGAGEASSATGGLAPDPLPEPVTLTVSIAGASEVYSDLILADELGEFAKENITIEYVTLPSTESLPMLAQGRLDVAAAGITATFFNGVNEGADMRIVMPGQSQPADGLWVRTDPATGTAMEMGSVATASGGGSPNALAIADYLASVGRTVHDVEWVQLPYADLTVGVEQGAVDAAWLASPAQRPLEGTGTAERVVSQDPGVSVVAYVMGPNLLQERPEVGQAFVRALARTKDTYLSDGYKSDAEVVDALARGLEVTPDDVTAAPELTAPTAFDEQWFNRLQATWLEIGDILSYDAPLPPDQFLDTTYLDALGRQVDS